MMTIYRTYSASWERTGYSEQPQYSGQMPCSNNMDFPSKCDCGQEIVGGGIPAWLRFLNRGPQTCHIGDDYVAWCKNGHRVDRVSVFDLIEDTTNGQ